MYPGSDHFRGTLVRTQPHAGTNPACSVTVLSLGLKVKPIQGALLTGNRVHGEKRYKPEWTSPVSRGRLQLVYRQGCPKTQSRLASNSETLLPLPLQCWDGGCVLLQLALYRFCGRRTGSSCSCSKPLTIGGVSLFFPLTREIEQPPRVYSGETPGTLSHPIEVTVATSSI